MRTIHLTRTQVVHQSIVIVNIIGVLLALALLSNTFGIVDLSLLHLVALYLLLGVTLLNLPLKHTVHLLRTRSSVQKKTILGIILMIAGFLLLLFSITQQLWIASIPVFLIGLAFLLQTTKKPRQELQVLAVASFGYTMVYLLIQTIPPLWYVLQQISLFISHAMSVISGTPLLLGPSASGLWLLLLFLTILTSSFLMIPKKTRRERFWFSACITGLFFLWIIYLGIINIIAFSSNADTILYHPVFFAMCLFPTIFYLLRYPYTEIASDTLYNKRKITTILKTGTIWAAVLLFISASTLTIVITQENQSNTHHKVLFYAQHMLGTWDVPEYGKYGKDGVGMFGLWPVYLSTLGYEPIVLVDNTSKFLNSTQPPQQNITRYLNLTDYASIVESPTLTKDLLDDVSIVVVTNLNTSFTSEEQHVIWDFVNNGGSLLVLGDHTNVGGMQRPLNKLLSPVGISYRFDAALPLDETQKWLTCTRFLQHPITIPLTSDELQEGVGASLNITTSAIPVIVGTYALSDEGNQSSGDLAYLGDYTYNKGEQLGDVILVAAAYYGNGKVLVFGDTSMFQNTALPFSYPFLQSTFSWLSSTQTSTLTIIQIGISFLLLIGALLLYRFSKDRTTPFVVFPAVLCAALILTAAVNPLLLSHTTPSGPLVAIDASHNERFSQDAFTDESVNGLLLNLQRNNLLPIIQRQFSADTITASKILVCIAPTIPFSGEEITVLKQFMANGGYVILAAGYDDKDASASLLQPFNISIEQTPLGPVPYIEGNTTLYQDEPRFVDSWPLSFPEQQTTSYYNFTWDDTTYHLVVFEKYGTGGLLVISDSQFLFDKNLESIYDYWPGNIIFLKHLITELHIMEMRP